MFRSLLFLGIVAFNNAYAESAASDKNLSSDASELQLNKLPWTVIPVTINADGSLKLRARFGPDVLPPKLGDRMHLRTVGSKTEQFDVKVESVQVSSDNSISVSATASDLDKSLRQRNWPSLSGFDVLVTLHPYRDTIWIDRSCDFFELPDLSGVTCETLQYTVRAFKDDRPLVSVFSNMLAGKFDPIRGVLVPTTWSHKSFVKKNNKWERQ